MLVEDKEATVLCTDQPVHAVLMLSLRGTFPSCSSLFSDSYAFCTRRHALSHPYPSFTPFVDSAGARRVSQVVNEGDGRPGGGGLTVSVNTNWFNGFNLARVYAFLRSELDAVRSALDHLRDSMSDGPGGRESREWERQCELVMRANSALNMTEFARLVVARARLLLGDVLAVGGGGGGGSGGDGDADVASVDESSPPLIGSREATNRGSGRAEGTSAAQEASPRHRDGIGIGTGEPREERWTVLSLEQVRTVLRELSVSPCTDHIFLTGGDDDDNHNDGDERRRDRNESRAGIALDGKWALGDTHPEAGARQPAFGGTCSLRETLEAVEAYLSGRCRSKLPRETTAPPSV